MLKDDEIRLRHMLEAAKQAVSFVENRTREELDNDRQLELALIKSNRDYWRGSDQANQAMPGYFTPNTSLLSNLEDPTTVIT